MAITRLFRSKKEKIIHEGPKKLVLCVEDIQTNWEICKAHLEDIYEMHHATHSIAAVEKLKAFDFDMILMDIELEGSEMDGITLTQALRGKLGSLPEHIRELGTIDTPIIFLTGYTTLYDRTTAHQAGGTDLFGKPVDFGSLMRTMERVLTKDNAGD